MKHTLLLPLLLALPLISCGENSSSNSSSFSGDSSQDYSTSDSSLSLEGFDIRLVGTWYVHTSGGVIELNTSFFISEDGAFTVAKNTFYYSGHYAGYEETGLFRNAKNSSYFIASYDDSDKDDIVINWGYMSPSNVGDMGVARSEEYTPGIKYSYVGKDWPLEKINTFLGTEGTLPVYEAAEYSLYTGTTQLSLPNPKYAMIDIFSQPSSARSDYAKILNENGYTIKEEASSVFWSGPDSNKIFYVRLLQSDDNLSIFVYHYSSWVTE